MRSVILIVFFAIASNAYACKCGEFPPWYNATDRARALLIDAGQLSPPDRVTMQLARVVAIDKNRARVEVLELFRGAPINELQFIPPDGHSCSLNLTLGENVLLTIREAHAISCLSHLGLSESIVHEIRRMKSESVESLLQQSKKRRHK